MSTRTKPFLKEGVLQEPLAKELGLALWLPVKRCSSFQLWERFHSVPHSEVVIDGAVMASVASVISARQRLRSLWSSLRKCFEPTGNGQQWILPNGGTAEQTGRPQDDALLIWSKDDVTQLDDAWIRAHWPQAVRVEQIGLCLFLVTGVHSIAGDEITKLAQVEGCPLQWAEQALANARRKGSRRAEATALIDIAIIHQNQNNLSRCMTLLGESLEISWSLGDHALQCDVLSNIGFAWLSTGKLQRSIQFLQQALLLARQLDDNFVTKMILERLGHAYFQLGQI